MIILRLRTGRWNGGDVLLKASSVEPKNILGKEFAAAQINDLKTVVYDSSEF
jgi:hypothetical protein